MIVDFLSSGSEGNCAILTDAENNQLIIDCGITYNQCATKINFETAKVIITHKHLDHALIKDKLELLGLDIYDHSNLVGGKIYNIDNAWKILPIEVKHGDCPNFAFIIQNKVERKNIFWATDLEEMPLIEDKTFDLLAVEVNYIEEYALQSMLSGGNPRSKYFTHQSLETALKWLTMRQSKAKNLIAIHTSNSGLIDFNYVLDKLKDYGDNISVATKNMQVKI